LAEAATKANLLDLVSSTRKGSPAQSLKFQLFRETDSYLWCSNCTCQRRATWDRYLKDGIKQSARTVYDETILVKA
jgi:hypothetical protein